MYSVIIVQCSIAPSEFWKMTPSEVMEILDVHRPKTINGIDEDDFDNMMDRRNKLMNDGVNVL